MTYKKYCQELPIVNDESTRHSNFTIVSIKASFKNVLLGLFSPHNKEFKLVISYTDDMIEYQTTFVALIPIIQQE